ncbi:lanthionine synthetase C family protein [Kitasatospora sp. NPDC056731]|uniref:lanthionine synthetase C family protein n=1 Tax=Kitasatospora sp. NPDC056731 TaxID=3155422 RepID=UPI00341B8E7C
MTASVSEVAADRLAEEVVHPDVGDDLDPQSLIRGTAAIALLAVERATAGRGSWDTAHRWLAASIREGAETGEHATLFYGAPALAFTFHGAAHPSRYDRALTVLDSATTAVTRERLKAAHARIDRRKRPALAEFDLIYGLTGLGAHHLRRDPHGQVLRDVLAYLVRLTEPIDVPPYGLPGWWTDLAPSGELSPQFPDGHANQGMAHGIAGPLALLSLAMKRGITVDGHAQAIGRICDWLDQWQQRTTTGAWWPEWITLDEHRIGVVHQQAPMRPSWCYGTPGLARAQQLAGQATDDPARQRLAETALLDCLADPAQLARITDSGLCHGWAGLFQAAVRVADAADGPEITERLAALLPYLVDGPQVPHSGFLDGAAGLALALHTATGTAPATGWDSCLLLN